MKQAAWFKHAIVNVLSHAGLKGMLLAAPDGYLRESGWMRSARARRPVDVAGQSQPWLTMPAIAFLDGRLNKTMRVMEYGSGGSTAWYGRRVDRVTSVEHDPQWYDAVKRTIPANVDIVLCPEAQPGTFLDLVFRPLGDPLSYARTITSAALAGHPHVVVVDGIDRLNCIAIVAAEVPESTVVVVDNLEYSAELRPALDLLADRGYRQLDFWGVAPGELRLTNTGIFYRSGNCLEI